MYNFIQSEFSNIYIGFINHDIIFISIVSIIITLLLLNKLTSIFKSSKFGLFIFSLPGTFMHELMHFFIGVLFLGSPNMFSLIPSFKDDYVTLGYVSFSRLRFWNSIPIAMAPLLLLPLSIYMLDFFLKISLEYSFTIKNSLLIFSYSYLIFSTISHSIPSGPDFKIASNFIGVLFYIALSIGIFYKIMYN